MKTLFVGQSLLRLRIVDSTNSYAQELIKSSTVHEGTIIMADTQTNGRGQRGNNWLSEPYKNLTFSLVMYPTFLHVDQHFYLNKVITIAIQSFLKDKLFDEVKVKWPNDIYVNDMKIGGILIENTLKGKKIGTSVIGIGLNINQDVFRNNLKDATSLKLETGKFYNLEFCLEELCSCIEASFLKLKSNIYSLDKLYLESLYRINEFHTYEVGNKKLQLKITGVDISGKLITQSEGGEEYKFDFKEISFKP